MKLRTLLSSSVLVVAAIVGASLYAQNQPAAPAGGPGAAAPGGPGGAPQAPKTELANHMSEISRLYGMNGLQPQINDLTKKEDSLKKVEEIRAHFVAAAKLTPVYLGAQPEENKEKFMTDYKAQVAKMLTTIDSLIAALKAGNAADIATHYTAMSAIQRESHPVFRAPRGRGGRGPAGAGAGGPGGPGGGGAPGAAGAPASPGGVQAQPGGGAPRGN